MFFGTTVAPILNLDYQHMYTLRKYWLICVCARSTYRVDLSIFITKENKIHCMAPLKFYYL